MTDKPTLQELLEVQDFYDLPSPALVEKDWYVVKALAAITVIDTSPFKLVFGGGTALGRAHRLIHRMSEDIDLKVVANEPQPPRLAFRQLREKVTQALLEVGFKFDPGNTIYRESRNQSRYTVFRLPCEPITTGNGALRPEIQIELATRPLRLASVEKSVSSFIAEAFKRPAEVPVINCIAISETAAEKLVALTRRAGAELMDAQILRDPTIIRHIYDLHVIREHYEATEIKALFLAIMQEDAETFGHQFPAYRDNPLAETVRVIEGLESDPDYAQNFAKFYRDMVYGKDDFDFTACLKTLKALSMLLTEQQH